MKKVLISTLLLASLAITANACITPVKPVAPAGCTASDAVLITSADGTCIWVFLGC